MEAPIKIDFSEELRARRIISRSNARVTGKYPGFKSRRMHHWESVPERDGFFLLDADPAVIGFAEQPAIIFYGAKLARKHYPDILVTYRNRQEFIEVKTDADAASEEIMERTALLTPALAAYRYSYRVWTESQIRHATAWLENCKFLVRFGRPQPTLIEEESFRRLFSLHRTVSWQSIVGTPPQPIRRSVLCHQILTGKLRIDRNELIHPASLVSVEA